MLPKIFATFSQKTSMKFIVIIPARYASTRFPGKPLVQIQNKPMVQHVYERCSQVCDTVYVATDDERIAEAVHQFGGKYVITSAQHPSGTDRCAEAAELIGKEVAFDVIINVQGDEPFIEPSNIEKIMQCFENEKTEIATLVSPISSNEILFDPNKVKVILNSKQWAVYFSRQPIPFQRDSEPSKWIENHTYYLHVGMYAFKRNTLRQITRLQPSSLEMAEKLEQLRWIENGYAIKTAICTSVSTGIDTPEDLEGLATM
jgi:3-deoxy-manno-octulosonate cytidylyltransferase (CMP-KDO synthetase)